MAGSSLSILRFIFILIEMINSLDIISQIASRYIVFIQDFVSISFILKRVMLRRWENMLIVKAYLKFLMVVFSLLGSSEIPEVKGYLKIVFKIKRIHE